MSRDLYGFDFVDGGHLAWEGNSASAAALGHVQQLIQLV